MKPIRAVLFDLDGTLMDSAPDLVGALNHVRRSEGLSTWPVPEMSPYASRGAAGLLNAGMPATDPETFETWRLAFLDYYALNSFRHSIVYDGITEVLEFLASNAIPWGIVTNKHEALTLPIVEQAGWKDLASCVVCGDTLSRAKPDPAPVSLACGIIGVEPADTLFVGDDVRDIQAGVAAGTQTAAVHYGYGSYEFDGSEWAGDYQVHLPGDLLRLVRPESELWNPV